MTGASAEVAGLLRCNPAIAGLDLARVEDRTYVAQVRVVPAPPGPLHRAKVLADFRLEAATLAPARLNLVIEGSAEATVALIRFLLGARAVTGQVLAAAPLKRPAP